MKDSTVLEWLLTHELFSTKARPSSSARLAKRPINQTLFELLRSAILAGNLRAGLKLPSSRELMQQLGISRNTVLYVFNRLVDEGYATTEVGRGTFISDTVPDPSVLSKVPDLTQHSGDQGKTSQRSSISRRAELLMSRPGASEIQVGAFVPGIPDVSHFPYKVWNRLLAKQWKSETSERLGYGSSRGYLPLKRALAEYLRLARGVRCDDSQILITHGSHQALDLCARLLADVGDQAWIEDPCYWGARSVFLGAGLGLRAIPVDEDGICPPTDGLTAPKLIFVTPSHQYPSGAVMSLTRRRLLLEIARRNGAWIIEDDYDSEFRYHGLPLPSLQGLDEHQRTIYVGSFSKVMYPGIRLGFLVVPPSLVGVFATLHSELYRGGSLTLQAALAEFIFDGNYAAHVRRMRKVYGERQALLTGELKRQLGQEASVMGTEAGLHLTLTLRNARDVAVSEASLKRGIVARPLSAYYDKPASAPSGLVLGYGGVADEAIAESVEKLAAGLADTLSARNA
ncbi:MAG: PLP-dependent aminotransferase family protein [Sterolibacterium sp.]|jgi:GntR family transcriptional regulator/MocR family aminotransferase